VPTGAGADARALRAHNAESSAAQSVSQVLRRRRPVRQLLDESKANNLAEHAESLRDSHQHGLGDRFPIGH
jgi:hypothetical protein